MPMISLLFQKIKINLHIFEVFLEHLQIMATLSEKVKIFCHAILGGRLVNDSWDIILNICFKFVKKRIFFSKIKNGRS